MGQQLVKNYNFESKTETCMGGGNMAWKVYSGSKKDNAEQKVSIFIFEKKKLQKLSKEDKEEALIQLRKEPHSLIKYKHPNILSVIEPLIEDNEQMAFVTERVEYSLQHLFEHNPTCVYQSELELKMRVREVLEALSFFHNDVKQTLCSVAPCNVYVIPDGRWKIANFAFAVSLVNSDTLQAKLHKCDFSFQACRYDTIIQAHPDLQFSSPEVGRSECSFASDVFSLALLLLGVYRCKGSAPPYIITSIANLRTHETESKQVQALLDKDPLLHKHLPPQLKSLLKQMLDVSISNRPTVAQILNSQWLNDPFIQTIRHLEQLAQKDASHQQIFLEGLGKLVPKFEVTVLKKRVFPLLMATLSSQEHLSPHILQIVINTLQNQKSNVQVVCFNKQEFEDQIWTGIKALCQKKEMPAQALYFLIKHAKLFAELISDTQFDVTLSPLILKCLDCRVPKLQTVALDTTPFLKEKMDMLFLKSKLLPRILKLCLTQAQGDANSEALRYQAMQSLHFLYKTFDRTTVQDVILPALAKLRQIGTSSKINMLALDIYIGVSETIGVETIAQKILPQIVPLLIEPSLSKTEFAAYVKATYALIKQIEEQRLNFNNLPGQEDFDPTTTLPMPSSNTNNNNANQNIYTNQNQEDNMIQDSLPSMIQEQKNQLHSDFDFLQLFDNETSGFKQSNMLNEQQQDSISLISKANQKTEAIQQFSQFAPSEEAIVQQSQSQYIFNEPIEQQHSSQIKKPVSSMKLGGGMVKSTNANQVNQNQNQTQNNNWGINQQQNVDAYKQNQLFGSNIQIKQTPQQVQIIQNKAKQTSNQQQPQQSNMVKLDYDPFAELTELSSLGTTNCNSGSNILKQTTNSKQIQQQQAPQSNPNGWGDFDSAFDNFTQKQQEPLKKPQQNNFNAKKIESSMDFFDELTATGQQQQQTQNKQMPSLSSVLKINKPQQQNANTQSWKQNSNDLI